MGITSHQLINPSIHHPSTFNSSSHQPIIIDIQFINPSTRQHRHSTHEAINPSSSTFNSATHQSINPSTSTFNSSTHQSINSSTLFRSALQPYGPFIALQLYSTDMSLCMYVFMCLERAHGCLGAWEGGPVRPGPPELAAGASVRLCRACFFRESFVPARSPFLI